MWAASQQASHRLTVTPPNNRRNTQELGEKMRAYKSRYGSVVDDQVPGVYDQQELDKFIEAWKSFTTPWQGYSINITPIYATLYEMSYIGSLGQTRSSSEQAKLLGLWKGLSDSLDREVNKAALFYVDALHLIVAEMSSLRARWPYLTPETFGDMYGKCKTIGTKLTDAFEFMDLQLATLNTILQFVEAWIADARELTRTEWIQHRLAPDNDISKLKLLHISSDTKHLIQEIVTSLSNLRSLEKEWIDENIMTKERCRNFHRRDTVELIKNLQQKTVHNLRKQQWYYHLQAKAIIDYDSKPVGQSTAFGLFISNFNTFLYMANYYSAIPAANLYAKQVGLNETVSGLLLSMTPLAAVISTYFYSQWSNKSFTRPTRISTIFLVFGNYLYATAAMKQSCLRLFLGRLLVGAGGNRAANRRYIADFVEIENRSTQSIVFVAVSGLGMAAGPYVQSLMQYLPSELSIAGYTIDSLTGPPWIFFIAWLGFYLTFEFLFVEPTRSFAQPQQNIFEPLLRKQQSKDMGNCTYGRPDADSSNLYELLGSIVCLWIYFALKLVQEAVQTAAPLVTETNFGWTEAGASNLLTIIGLVALPTNFLVGVLAKKMDGRTLQLAALLGLFLGSIFTIDYSYFGLDFSPYQYITGAACLFLCAQVLEGINMALLSIIMPKRFSKGIFNTGFLSTEAGTLGRVCGALTITLAGSLAPVEKINNLVMISCALITMMTVALAMYSRNRLERPALMEGDEAGEFADALNDMKMSIGPMPFTFRSMLTSTNNNIASHGGYGFGSARGDSLRIIGDPRGRSPTTSPLGPMIHDALPLDEGSHDDWEEGSLDGNDASGYNYLDQ